MSGALRGPQQTPQVLATDLDGTLIPLAGHSQNQHALNVLRRELPDQDVTLTFVTGRHLESVEAAIAQHELPAPDWAICDVGTTIWQRDRSRDGQLRFTRLESYQAYLESIICQFPISALREKLEDINSLVPQEPEKQGRFKLSYYAAQRQLETIVESIRQRLDRHAAPYSLVHSLDPITGDGLIDLLPLDVSKAHALDWWIRTAKLTWESIVYAGDSGNDLAAFVAGYRTIVVANTEQSIVQQVCDAHQHAGWKNRLCLASQHGTSGVLEGCRWFGLLPGP